MAEQVWWRTIETTGVSRTNLQVQVDVAAGDSGRRDSAALRRTMLTHVKDLLPHGGRVGGTLVGQQPFGDGAGGRRLVVLVEGAAEEEGRNTS